MRYNKAVKKFSPKAHTDESRELWSEAAPRYAKLSDAFFAPMARELVVFAGIRKGWRVLDLACGPGVASRAAARAAGEKGGVLAADLAPGMIEHARSVPAEKDSASIEWRVLDAQKMDLTDDAFDAVICQLGLMLFAQPDAALSEMARVAKPSAPVTCLVQGRRSEMLFTAHVMDALMARAPELRAPEGAPTLFAFGPDGVLEKAFMEAGLVDIVTKRLRGTFSFSSPENYWETFVGGAGKTGAMLRSLSPALQAKVKADVLRKAARHRSGRGVAIPYEFALARGLKARA